MEHVRDACVFPPDSDEPKQELWEPENKVNFTIGERNNSAKNVRLHKHVVATATHVHTYHNCNRTAAPRHLVPFGQGGVFNSTDMFDPDDSHRRRLGDRSPWGARGLHLGQPANPRAMYTPILETSSTMMKTEKGEGEQKVKCQVVFVTSDLLSPSSRESYICTWCYGPEQRHYALLSVTMRDNERMECALRRLGEKYFKGCKHVARAINIMLNQPTHSRVEKEREGATVLIKQFGCWVSPAAALTMIPSEESVVGSPEDVRDSSYYDLTSKARIRWIEVGACISNMLADPYGGACAKSVLKTVNDAGGANTSTGNEARAKNIPCKKISDPSFKLRPRVPDFVQKWCQQVEGYQEPELSKRLANRTSPSSNPYGLPALIPQIAAAVMRLPQSACDAKQLQLIINLARERAFSHGSDQVTARDVIDAAQNLSYEEKHAGDKRPVPCDFPPHHYPELQQALARLADVVAQEKAQGVNPPWVLVACEKSAVIARHFRYAGCEVCTSDVLDTDDNLIPHFKGDARRITHLEFDLVIACPPCTYLCNASAMWLAREPHRWTAMRQAATLFKDFYNSPATHVCIENPVLNRHARQLLDNLKPTQIINPFEHGHSESKQTALYIRGPLPPLRATCMMVGRERRLRNLPPGPGRAASRGRFFMGIGAAMAAQWTSTLIQHCKQKAIQRIRPDLAEVIAELNAQETRRVQVGSDGYAAALIPARGKLPTYVAVMRPPPIGAPTNWVLCPHGAVLASGDEQALELLTERHPLPRCERAECIEDARAWWLMHVKAETYDEECKEAVNTANRPYPVRRIRYKGNSWYAFMPTAQKGATAGGYIWNRLADPVQHSITKEIDRLTKVRISNGGSLQTGGRTPLQNSLPAICDEGNDSRGFDPDQYKENNNEASRDKWEHLRAEWEQTARLCPICKAPRSHEGAKRCRCSELNTAGLGYQTKQITRPRVDRQGKSPRSPREGGGGRYQNQHEKGSQASKLIAKRILFVKAGATAPKRVCAFTESGHDDDSLPGPLIDLSAVPELARQVSKKIEHAATYGVAPTPDYGKQEAHCAYVSDLVIIDPERGEHLRVGSFVRYCIGDTGAGISVLAAGLARVLPYSAIGNMAPTPSHVQDGVVAADGKPLVILGAVQLTFYLGGRIFRHRFQVVEGGDLLILGNDFVAAHRGSVHPRLSNDSEEGYMEVDHEPSGDRVKTLLLPTPCDWVPVRRYTGRTSPTRGLVSPQVGGDARTSLDGTTDIAPHQVGGSTNRKIVSAVVWPPVKSNRSCYADASIQPEETEAAELPPNSIMTDNMAELKLPQIPDPSEKELYAQYLVTRDHLLVAHKPVAIPGCSERTLEVRLPKQLIGHKGPLLIKPLPRREGLGESPVLVAASICYADGPFIPIKVLNIKRETAFLAEMAALGTIETDVLVPASQEPSDLVHTWESLTTEQRNVINGCIIDEAGVLSEEQVAKVKNLLAAHVTVFAPNPKAPGTTHFLEVELELRPGAKPHKHAPSRLGPEGHRIAQSSVDELEKNGIIRKSSSPWASRIILVKKKSGEVRLCIDLRDLNSKLLIQDTPLPRCDDSICRLAAAPDPDGNPSPTKHQRFFHTIDLASAFHTLPIKEEHKERTAFVTERGKYEWNFLPFGVSAGPSYMTRLIESTIEGLEGRVAAYIDDIVGWESASTINEAFEKALLRLNLILERLRWAGLTAKATKCYLFSRSVDYLGHVIGQHGISPDPKKIEGISKIRAKEIDSLEKVRSFLGLCGYYRQFIENFHLISSSLTDLTKKGVNVRVASQAPEVQEAIETLKTALTTAPVLAPPKSDRPFILHTDAATGHGLGAILIQRDDSETGEKATGPERPIAYFGRKCNPAEKKYTVTECELLAVVEAIKHFRPYLWGQHFTVITDHSALRWLATMKDTINGGASSRLTRWSLKLQEYRFTVQHKPGKLHQDADAISRLVGCIVSPPRVSAIVPSDRKGPPTLVDLGVTRNLIDTAIDRLRDTLVDVNNIRDLAIKTTEKEPRPLLAYALDLRKSATDIALHGTLFLPNRTVLTMPVPVVVAAMMTNDALRKSQLSADVPRAETLREEQLKDEDCTDILAFLIAKCNPDDPKRAGWVSRNATCCTVKDGILNHTATINGVSTSRIWIPKTCREAFLVAYHDRLGHQSRDRVYQLMQKAVFWPGMSTDVGIHVLECHECTFSKKGSRQHGATRPPEVGLYPFELLIADVLSMRETEDGYKKVLIYADSLTRWIEAIPLKKDPTSAEVLDLFMDVIVSRHGVPRSIRSDCGSNLTSTLCREIYDLCGVNLSQSTAYHHQSAGIVERFNHTLTEMTKASDKEGRNWAKHLPFLVFCYNSTPHRVTRESPACLVYGRELRLPANMDLGPKQETTTIKPLSDYATALYKRLRLAWDVTLQHTYLAQAGEAERIDVRRHVNTTFAVGDRVLLKISTTGLNKLEYKWTGPYRVSELLGKGVYRLRDLHNQRIVDRVSTDRLKLYLTYTDAEPLAPDEFIVKSILNHRTAAGKRQYLVKWRGYTDTTWTDEKNLRIRCGELLDRYHRESPEAGDRGKKQPTPTHPVRKASPKDLAGLTAEREESPTTPSGLSDPTAAPQLMKNLAGEEYPGGAQEAKFERGIWMYKVYFPTSRGPKPRWLPTYNFTEAEHQRLEPLRDKFTADAPEAQQKICAMYASSAISKRLLGTAVTDPPGPDSSLKEVSATTRSAKVIFRSKDPNLGGVLLWVGARTDSDAQDPQWDLPGGKFDDKHDTTLAETAIRELREEMEMPLALEARCVDAVGGPCSAKAVCLKRGRRHEISIWTVDVGSMEAYGLSAKQQEPPEWHVAKWVDLDVVLKSLHRVNSLRPYSDAIEAAAATHPPTFATNAVGGRGSDNAINERRKSSSLTLKGGGPCSKDQVGGTTPCKLTALFDIADLVARRPHPLGRDPLVNDAVDRFVHRMGASSQTKEARDAILAVIYSHVHYDLYDHEEICKLIQVRRLHFTAWQYRMHTIVNTWANKQTTTVRVAFVNQSGPITLIWVGARSDNAEWDLPGGAKLVEDTSARDNAWREITTNDLKFPPSARARLSRSLAVVPPIVAEQTEVHEDRQHVHRIALWAQTVEQPEMSGFSHLDSQGIEKKWQRGEWIPLPELMDTIDRRSHPEYALGCCTAILLACLNQVAAPDCDAAAILLVSEATEAAITGEQGPCIWVGLNNDPNPTWKLPTANNVEFNKPTGMIAVWRKIVNETLVMSAVLQHRLAAVLGEPPGVIYQKSEFNGLARAAIWAVLIPKEHKDEIRVRTEQLPLWRCSGWIPLDEMWLNTSQDDPERAGWVRACCELARTLSITSIPSPT